jgi:NAD+ diphosphatase
MIERLENLPFAGQVMDRAATLRGDTARLRELWADESSRALVLSGDYACVLVDSGKAELQFRAPSELPGVDRSGALFLGLHADIAYFAVDRIPAVHLDNGASLRNVGALLGPRDAELFATALGICQWHRRHPHCSVCGELTVVANAGWVRRCPDDGSEHFPRTDPAVIMLVRDPDDRALLGRRAGWPTGWYSTLAGFVEPGEDLASAVQREVMEEANVDVDPASVQFLGSQPWPFPSSIMLGFHARARSGAPAQPDATEMIDARWFSRAELTFACEAGDVRLPSRISIARPLIERWYGSALPEEWSRS